MAISAMSRIPEQLFHQVPHRRVPQGAPSLTRKIYRDPLFRTSYLGILESILPGMVTLSVECC